MKYFKEGQTVYHQIYGKGVVTNANFENESYPIMVKFMTSTVSFTEDGRQYGGHPISLSQNPIPKIVNIPLDEHIPFTFEDKELLKGKWIKHKTDSSHILINYISDTTVGIDGSYYTYEELFRDFEFIDGKPCGKL